MARKPCVLIVDDDPRWTKHLTEVLATDFRIEQADSPREAFRIINSRRKIVLGIVDVRLNEDNETDRRGLDVLHLLSTRGIPSIATSAYTDTFEARVVRDALVEGGASDFWFKTRVDMLKLLGAVEHVSESSRVRAHMAAGIWLKLISFTSVVLLVLGAVLLVWQLIRVESAFTLVISAVIVLVSIVLLFASLKGGLRPKDFRELFTALLDRWFGRAI